MKKTYRQAVSHGDVQDLSLVINRMKTWDVACAVHKSKQKNYSQRLQTLESLREISRLLSEMLENGIFPNIVIINQLIKKMQQFEQINVALALHGIAVAKNIADAITYTSTINAIAKSATPNATLAVDLFNEAKRLGFADAITYASTITAIAKSAAPHAALAVDLFNEAKRLGLANAITYNSTIMAIAKSAAPNEALAVLAVDLFNEAKDLGFADEITYNSTIDAIAKSATPNAILAVDLFNEAKRLGFADAIIYASTITVIAKSATPDEDLAFTLLDEATQKFHRIDMKQERLIDLHGLSFGEVYFGLKRRLKTELENTSSAPVNLEIIYGQGLHRQASLVAGVHPLKEAAMRVIQEMPAQAVLGTERSNNPGIFDIMIHPPTQSVRHQSSALTQNSVFPSAGRRTLNPNAPVFIPKSS